MYWPSYPHEEIRKEVFKALEGNLNYRTKKVLGIPGTFLDAENFYEAPFLEKAPFLKTLVQNPNHIGCHTLGESETVFAGTQQVEKDVIRICAEEILQGEPQAQDGYIASGGTEANIQAMWLYRNYFQREYGAKPDEIAALYSEDSHYSMPKGVNLLGISSIVAKVEFESREINHEALTKQLDEAKSKGVKYIIAYANMATTMFGSVDDPNLLADTLDASGLGYKIHVDAAFGGFIYPFSNQQNNFNFTNPRLSSFTMDAHKMLQAPYGTGIFLIRKGLMQYTLTEEAGYVHGKDYTLVGSRSGANAIAVWMILSIYGSNGWQKRIQSLIERTDRLTLTLDELGIKYFRHTALNIVTIYAQHVPTELAEKYMLVPERHDGKNDWWKIVVMEHVTDELLDLFLNDLKNSL